MNKIIEKIKKDEIINLIQEHAKKYAPQLELYLVGGVFRDFYLGKENFDKDVVVGKIDAEKFAKSLAKAIDATFIVLDDENKVYRLVMKDKANCIDIASLIGDTIEDDLRRRDLTINSIAVNLKSFEIIDVTRGIDDLKSRKIKHISEQNFIDDPLRLLRVFRFAAMLGFDIDEDLINIVMRHAAKISQSAVERVNYEFLKLFSGDYSKKALIKMDETGLLKEILPVSEDLKKVPPNLHHHLNLFEHSIEIVGQIQKIYENSCEQVRQHLDKVDFGAASRLAHLKLAGFLHDIGKPSAWTIEEDTGKHRFIKHDDVGSKMASKILRSSKFSKKQTDYLTKMIKYHIYPSHVVSSPDISDKIYMRFIRKMQDEVIDVIILAMADRLSARGIAITQEIIENNINNLQMILNFYLNVKDHLEPLPKLLSGEEIMELLNIKPSKKLGEIIKLLHEAQLSSDITTKEDAITFVKHVGHGF